MTAARLQRLAQALPFHYGRMILTVVCFACASSAGTAVATLAMFVTPMTAEFGCLRTELSGAVSCAGAGIESATQLRLPG
jgi:hypothetical protein